MNDRFSTNEIQAERIAAVDGSGLADVPASLSPGGLGCLLSHVKALELLIRGPGENALIFEDDAELTYGFSQTLHEWMPEVPRDWELLYLGAGCLSPIERVTPHVARVKRALGAHAYAVQAEAARALLSIASKREWHIDRCMTQIQERGRSYCFVPFLATQESGFSDIQRRMVTWDRWMHPAFTTDTLSES
jgi:glycosyl transferase family 25